MKAVALDRLAFLRLAAPALMAAMAQETRDVDEPEVEPPARRMSLTEEV